MKLEDYTINEEGWVIDNITPCDAQSSCRYQNVMAKVNRDENGTETYEYIKCAYRKTAHHNFNGIKRGDVLLFANFDHKKGYTINRTYYLVMSVTKKKVTLMSQFKEGEKLTYLRCKKAWKEIWHTPLKQLLSA